MKPHRESTRRPRPPSTESGPSNFGTRAAKTPALRTQTYNIHTGQVFQETEINASNRQRSDWIGEWQTPNLVKKRPPNASGARSLFDMAKGTVARQMRGISSQHLSDVPWEIAEHVWNEIIETRSESFHAWRTFAAAYSEHFSREKYRYLIDIKQPRLPLEDYYKGISSVDVNWLTCLRIAPREIPLADVIRIADIRNLAVLDLSDGNTTEASAAAIDERVFKTWSELAIQGAFQHLKVLLLGWQEGISKWIFKYINHFPSLCYILVTDSLNIHQRNRRNWEVDAAKHGWLARSAKRSAKSLRPLLDEKSFYLGAVSGCYYSSQELLDQLATDKNPDMRTRRPVLECWIGSPRIWAHVVEEYPGTRTVWFDNVTISSSQISDPQVTTGEETESRDQNKRGRDLETPTKELHSPPPKRTVPRRQLRGRSATELLAEFGHM